VLTIFILGTRTEQSAAPGFVPHLNVNLGTFVGPPHYRPGAFEEDGTMDGLIYLIGLIVVIMAILSFFGLR